VHCWWGHVVRLEDPNAMLEGRGAYHCAHVALKLPAWGWAHPSAHVALGLGWA